jgi:hypothetical protein
MKYDFWDFTDDKRKRAFMRYRAFSGFSAFIVVVTIFTLIAKSYYHDSSEGEFWGFIGGGIYGLIYVKVATDLEG